MTDNAHPGIGPQVIVQAARQDPPCDGCASAGSTDLPGFVSAVMHEQRVLNRATHAITLSRAGGQVVSGDRLMLEATFWTETEQQAAEFARHLAGEHGYAVRILLVPAHVEHEGDQPEMRSIVARTPPIPLELDVLDEWTDAMVWAGWKHGSAEFDGWSAVLPSVGSES